MPQTLEEFCQTDSLLSQFSQQEISALKPHFATLRQIHAIPMRAIAVCSHLHGNTSNLYTRDSQIIPSAPNPKSTQNDIDSQNLALLSESKCPNTDLQPHSLHHKSCTNSQSNTDSQPNPHAQIANTTCHNANKIHESQSNPYTTLMQQEALHLFLPHISATDTKALQDLIFALKPWRKGPFCFHFLLQNSQKTEIAEGRQNAANKQNEGNIAPFFIDSEWQSNTKMKLIVQTLQTIGYDLQGKNVLDVGCNNGYYMLDLALRGVRHITGIDPIAPFFLQFYLIAKLSCLPHCSYRLLGVQDTAKLHTKYDLILCLGVLYHRKEPLETLKQLKSTLQPNGTLILETLIIESEQEICLCPYPTYAKMPNVYYVFSPKALQNLAYHAGFATCELISFSYTDNTEQRTTEFITTQSLGDFLSHTQTFEGYPPACRGIFILSR